MTNRRRMPLAIICPLSQQASLEFVLLRTGDLIASNSGVVQTALFCTAAFVQVWPTDVTADGGAQRRPPEEPATSRS
jgi:hypothetical protein